MRWVSTVPRKISGAVRNRRGLPSRTEARTKFRAPVILHPGDMVAGHDDQTGRGQQQDKPPVGVPQGGGGVNGVVKGGA